MDFAPKDGRKGLVCTFVLVDVVLGVCVVLEVGLLSGLLLLCLSVCVRFCVLMVLCSKERKER